MPVVHEAESPHAMAVQTRRAISTDEIIYQAGAEGIAWRIRKGAVRLDRVIGEARSFAGLALAGDVIGAETLLYGHYSFHARALSDGALEPWLSPDKALAGESLLQMLTTTERRAADALSLRAGEALERVRQLILLLAGDSCTTAVRQISIPGLRDMADMTGLTVETVSRAISQLRKSGLMQKSGRRAALVFPQFGNTAPN